MKQKIGLILFGVIGGLLLIEIGLRLSGFVVLTMQEWQNTRALEDKKAYRILCVGESTTAGSYNSTDSYPRELEKILNLIQNKITFKVINRGIWATDTAGILTRLETDIEKYQPDMVVVMMGINDGKNYIIPYSKPGGRNLLDQLSRFQVYKLGRLLWLSIHATSNEKRYRNLKIEQDTNINITTKKDLKPFEKDTETENSNNTNFSREQDYIELGDEYKRQGEFQKAIEMYQRALMVNPYNARILAEQGWIFTELKEFGKADKAFQQALEIDPGNDNASNGVGWRYYYKGQFAKAENIFNKAIQKARQANKDYTKLSCFASLADIYYLQGALGKVQEMYQQVIAKNPLDDIFYGRTAQLYLELGRTELASEYFKKANDIRNKRINKKTMENYQKLRNLVIKKEIRLVCVQYPVRRVESLKIMLEPYRDIIFVDNEKIFKDAIKKDGYYEYFCDFFGGDFGHCVKKGNALLAKNIADVILKEIFKIKIDNGEEQAIVLR